jgi:hypothetical protein
VARDFRSRARNSGSQSHFSDGHHIDLKARSTPSESRVSFGQVGDPGVAATSVIARVRYRVADVLDLAEEEQYDIVTFKSMLRRVGRWEGASMLARCLSVSAVWC